MRISERQVGTVRAVADASGDIVKEITYDSFGNILEETNPTFTIPLGFAGGLHDRDTGLVRFGFRDYDPDSGRWTAKDALGFAAGNVDFYAYCGSNTLSRKDATGLNQYTIDVGFGLMGRVTVGWTENQITFPSVPR